MGRPISFDKDKALEQALEVFIEYGYEGATLEKLSNAMGIWKQSLYSSFGGKEELFHQSLEKYTTDTLKPVYDALQLPTAHAVITELLKRYVIILTDPNLPHGCLIVQSMLSCSNDHVRSEVLSRESFDRKLLSQRLARSKVEGDLSTNANPDEIALYIATFSQGLAIAAAKGEKQTELLKLVEMTIDGLSKYFTTKNI